jgi:hypothetical protein
VGFVNISSVYDGVLPICAPQAAVSQADGAYVHPWKGFVMADTIPVCDTYAVPVAGSVLNSETRWINAFASACLMNKLCVVKLGDVAVLGSVALHEPLGGASAGASLATEDARSYIAGGAGGLYMIVTQRTVVEELLKGGYFESKTPRAAVRYFSRQRFEQLASAYKTWHFDMGTDLKHHERGRDLSMVHYIVTHLLTLYLDTYAASGVLKVFDVPAGRLMLAV